MARDPRQPRRPLNRSSRKGRDDLLKVAVRWEESIVTDAWMQLWHRIFRDIAAGDAGSGPQTPTEPER